MSEKQPTVSIIIPCYNCEQFVGETMDAVLAQTYSDWECILIDDASTDGSADVIREYAARDERFRPVLLERNVGAAGARNAGLDTVRGRYIAFLDSDDFWVPEKLEKQISFIEETGAPIVHSSYRFVDEDGEFLPGGVKATDRVDLRLYMRNTEIGMSTSLVDGQQTGEFRLRDIRLCQDTNLWLELLSRGFVSRGIEEVLVHYRVREGQISGSKFGMAKQVFLLWMGIKQVSLPMRLFSFASYAVNGFRKRMQTPD
ncbi:MAG: glycosyl transferase [Verrucomicrobiales bacterium]|nr:glycosyl transferase [Verrucomicrobiales bacterium]